jgi:NADH-quinone oxidoreductase subunit M
MFELDKPFALPALLMLVPTAGGLVGMTMMTRRAAGVVSVLTAALQTALIVIGAAILGGWDTERFALVQRREWFDAWNIDFSVAVSSPALAMVALTTLVTLCVSLFGWSADRDRPAAYHGLLWLTAAGLSGLFVAQDLVLFYVFFELMLVPMFILVGVWGGAERVRATLTMFIYTLVGSLAMLGGIVYVGLELSTFDMTELAAVGPTIDWPWWVPATFALAFAIKAPLVFLHGWMPLAYREALPEVTGVLSAIVSKAAMWGVLVVLVPIFASELDGTLGTCIAAYCLITLLYGSFAAFRAPDARGVIAYSSMAQMGLILLGLFVFSGRGGLEGISGAYLQSINHGLISAAMFLTIAVIERRAGTGELRLLGGLASGRPMFATVVMVLGMIALAVPGSTTFAGEFAILSGVFRGEWDSSWLLAAIGSAAVVFAALYVLRFISAVLHTADKDEALAGVRTRERFGGDLSRFELAVLAPLLIALLALSAWPAALKRPMNETSAISAATNASTPKPKVSALPAEVEIVEEHAE